MGYLARLTLKPLLILLGVSGVTNVADAATIGIVGDVHGEVEPFRKALEILREQKVSHIIGTGDFVRWGGPEELDEILSMIERITGVAPENTFLIPGNWEHETGFAPTEMNVVMKKYGHLVFDEYDSYGSLEVAGKNIFLSHFPVRPVPEEFLPPPRFRRRVGNQAFVMDTVKRNIPIPPQTDLAIFAHTHIGGAFYDQASGVYFVNAGVMNTTTKSPDEPLGLGIYDTQKREVEFRNAETGKAIHKLEVTPLRLDPPLSCKILIRKPFEMSAPPVE